MNILREIKKKCFSVLFSEKNYGLLKLVCIEKTQIHD